MLEVTFIGSGSSGNAAVVRAGSTVFLLDAGLSARRIVAGLGQLGLQPSDLSGILITHEHQDHVSGLPVLCKKHGVPIIANRMTSEVLRRDWLPTHTEWRVFQTGATFSIGDVEIESFSVPHDAVDPVGYVFRNGSGVFGVLTDLGYATRLVLERVREAGLLLIETNHDEKLLHADLRRPWSIKQRILSRHGHLSNDAAAKVVAELSLGGHLERVVLGHLSRDCNEPELAISTLAKELRQSRSLAEDCALGVDLFCASPREISPTFAAGSPAAQGCVQAQPMVQGSLFDQAH